MEGVILFADNSVFEKDTFENNLFNDLCKEPTHPVLPVNSLQFFEKTTGSISTFKAIILDWNFGDESDDLEGAKLPVETPLSILESIDIFSLVFVYSRTEISAETQQKLKTKFGDKIDFVVKDKNNDIKSERERLLKKITDFEKANSHLHTPFLWSQAINKSVQHIFKELEYADKYWIKDLYYSSYIFDNKGKPKDPPPIDPNIQVINLFQNLLSERLIQDEGLRNSIRDFSVGNLEENANIESLKRLYQRLYYTNALRTDAIMTGDVYRLSDDKYGVIISPECDMNILIAKDKQVELLCFNKDDFKKLPQLLSLKKEDIEIAIPRAYNQENPRYHLLPVFPISTMEMQTALIDFRFSLQHCNGSFLRDNIDKRILKINSPYIQQLRQRYLAYIGRVGVPAIPDSLRIV
jgi:hypothetical protein